MTAKELMGAMACVKPDAFVYFDVNTVPVGAEVVTIRQIRLENPGGDNFQVILEADE